MWNQPRPANKGPLPKKEEEQTHAWEDFFLIGALHICSSSVLFCPLLSQDRLPRFQELPNNKPNLGSAGELAGLCVVVYCWRFEETTEQSPNIRIRHRGLLCRSARLHLSFGIWRGALNQAKRLTWTLEAHFRRGARQPSAARRSTRSLCRKSHPRGLNGMGGGGVVVRCEGARFCRPLQVCRLKGKQRSGGT